MVAKASATRGRRKRTDTNSWLGGAGGWFEGARASAGALGAPTLPGASAIDHSARISVLSLAMVILQDDMNETIRALPVRGQHFAVPALGFQYL